VHKSSGAKTVQNPITVHKASITILASSAGSFNTGFATVVKLAAFSVL
jgi:hypothetical protein